MPTSPYEFYGRNFMLRLFIIASLLGGCVTSKYHEINNSYTLRFVRPATPYAFDHPKLAAAAKACYEKGPDDPCNQDVSDLWTSVVNLKYPAADVRRANSRITLMGEDDIKSAIADHVSRKTPYADLAQRYGSYFAAEGIIREEENKALVAERDAALLAEQDRNAAAWGAAAQASSQLQINKQQGQIRQLQCQQYQSANAGSRVYVPCR
jgi:hypothetical protein